MTATGSPSARIVRVIVRAAAPGASPNTSALAALSGSSAIRRPRTRSRTPRRAASSL
jgi:hypothetical protein